MTERVADLSESDARAYLATVMADLVTLEDNPIEPKSAEPKSSLSIDDQEFRLLSTSQLTQAGIFAAREHLLAMGYVWHSHDGGTLMPQAYATLARAALIGASNVVWLLTPLDRDERVRRTLLLANANFRNAATAQLETLASAPIIGVTDVEVLATQRVIVEGARANVQEVEAEWWRRFPRPGGGKAAEMEKFDQTKVIDFAHIEVTKDDPSMGPYGKMYWRLMSGDAHAFVWQKVHRASMTGELAAAIAGSDDTFTFTDTHTAKSLLPFVLMPAMVFRHAYDLWGFRAAPPACKVSSPSSLPIGAR